MLSLVEHGGIFITPWPDQHQQNTRSQLDPKHLQQSCSKKYTAIRKLNHGIFTIGFVFMLLLYCTFGCNFVSSKILFSL